MPESTTPAESDNDWVDEFLREAAESATGAWGPTSPEEQAERDLWMPMMMDLQDLSLRDRFEREDREIRESDFGAGGE